MLVTIIYQLPEINIKNAVYRFFETVDKKKNANADDLDAIKLMCQQPLASGCDEEFAIMCRNLVHQHAKTMPTSQQEAMVLHGWLRSLID